MGNEIKFTIGKSEIIIKEGKKVKIKNEDSLDSNVRSIFNAIANSDTNDKVDKTEYNIFEKLKTVFDNLGDWNKDNDVNKEDFNKYCQDVYDANSENENPISDMVKDIELIYNELTKKSPKPENINEDPQPPEPPTQIEESDNIIEEEVANEEVVIITSDEDTSTTQ